MRIAFASCMSAQVFPQQPVWDWIAARNPDGLVLLGDSIYLDVPLDGPHPSAMDDDSFARHALQRYQAQLAQPCLLRRWCGPWGRAARSASGTTTTSCGTTWSVPKPAPIPCIGASWR